MDFMRASKDSFDEWSYMASNTDLITAFNKDTVAGTKHYVNYGFEEGRKVVILMVALFASNTDLIDVYGSSVISGVNHYINHGFAEGYSLDSFQALNYLNKYSI